MPELEPPKTLAEALTVLQARLPRVAKTNDAQVGPRTYKYADLTDVSEALLPLLASLGLSFTACPTMLDGGFVLDYQLHHVSGERIGGFYALPTSGSPQQVGSAITYARRYSLCAVTGLAPGGDDDDGQAGEQAHETGLRRAEAGNRPGSSNAGQWQTLGILYTQLGITEKETRLAEMTDRVGREIGSAKDLSHAEAEAAIRELRGLAGQEGAKA